MGRGLAYKRWRADLKFARVRKRERRNWSHDRRFYLTYGMPFTYFKKNSISETIEVTVLTESHYEDYMDLRARKARDNPKVCSCCACCNPRRAANNGNSMVALPLKQGAFIAHSVHEISECDTNTPHFRWKRRKWRTSY